jgi:hypothetical protein
MFAAGFSKIKKNYGNIVKSLDYSNQPYIFDFQKFQAANPFQFV